MLKKNLYTCLLLAAVLLLAKLSFGQCATDPSLYTTLPVGVNGNVTAGSSVCPSTLATPSISVFSVPAVIIDAGDPASNTFEWAVYGGWITEINGVSTTASQLRTAASTRYSCLSVVGVDGSFNSTITVVWDTTNYSVVPGWVAVRQTSEYGCSEGLWSVYTNDIQNLPPVFNTPIATIILPNPLGVNNYTLPIPLAADQDACSGVPLSFSFQILDNLGTVLQPTTLVVNPGTENTLVLLTDTNHVVWTVSDGGRIDTTSYYIIVEPELDILKVALINPNCGTAGTPATNGSAYVTDYTHYNFTTAVQYRYDGGAWGNVPAMGAGSYTIQAGLFYNVDLNGDAVANDADDGDWVLSPVYSYTLEETSYSSVDNIPTDAPDATVVDASCLSSNDGTISISTADDVMGPLNNSVSFNGTSSYLALNKSYNTTSISSFSVAAWIKTSASSGTILSFNGDAYFNLALSAGRVQLTAQPSSGAGTTVTAQTVVADGFWHLVTATYNGSEYNLFLDTMLVETLPGSGNIGIGLPYYGMIGARSGATDFGQAPTGFYFDGQIAEVGIWDNGALTRDNVISMFTSGMGSLGPSDRWVLNDAPAAAETVFVDLGNGSNTLDWGRFVNCSVVTNDAPKLYSWVDIPTLGVATRNNLKAGSSYTFQVRDVYGCGLVDHTYTIGNSDTDAPLILWNVAVGKPATQSSLTDASMASDGFFSTPSATSSEANPWWDISLNGNYPIPMVRITANSTLANAYVIVSPSQIAATSLADYLALPGIEVKQLSLAAGTTGFVTFDDDVWGTYVRIWANETTSLSLGEVEVLTNQQPPDTRHLYLDTDCDYPLSGDDATVDLVAYDVCGGPTTIVNSIDNDASITGLNWPPIGSGYDVTWTATDEVEVAGVHTNTSSLLMHYEVADSVFPKFVESPFTGVPTNFTACQALTYQFPIPKVTDNLHDCAPYQYINLYVDGWLAYEYPEADLQNLTYYNNYSNPGLANAIPSLMDPDNVVVEHTIRWEIRDGAGNMIFEELEIEIEPEPKIREIKVSPISCPGSGNGYVYFSKYDGDATPTSIQFILRNTVSGTEISSGSSPVAAPAGVYQAFININGCPSSDPYPFDVELNQPGDIELVVDTTHVICYGLGDGAIDIEPSGGSETNVLHLWDGGSVGAGDDPAVNIAAEGMIECWMFLDSLASGGTNWDATIFSAGTFGLRMAGGQLEFFATGNSAFPSITISQRRWYHVAGAIHSGLLELYLDGSMIASQPLDAAILPLDGAGIAIGPLNGFVRNARIWNAFPASFGENINMSSPIDINNNLVANFPINAAGGTTVTNVVNGTYSGAVAGNNSRQQFAYYWTDPDGVFLDFTQDIKNVVAGNYKVILYDPQGCPPFEDEIEVKTADDVAPTMTFYSNHARDIELGIGQNIIRTTTQTDWGNLADDCIFIPSADEFNPKVSDGICPVTSAYVTLSYSLVAGSDLFVVDPASTSSLDGSSMTGIMTLLWSAKDLTNPATTMEVTYYIVDNGTPGWYANFPDAPTVPILDTIVYVPVGSCQYTVQPGECLAYVDDDCNTGILKNNLNGENNLDGYKLDLGTHNVTWTYTDRIFPGQTAPTPITTLRRITVIDNTAPTVTCTSPGTVYLDDLGQAALTINDLVSTYSDNCSATTPTLVVSKNISNGMGAAYVTQSSTAAGSDPLNAVDNSVSNGLMATTDPGTAADPAWWQVDLNGAKTIYGVRLFAASLSNFWIVVSNDGNFAPPVNFLDDNTTWGANIVYHQHVTSAVAGGQFFSFNKPAVGSVVRIWCDNAGALSLNEVEVYAVAGPAASVTLECVDARYTPNADPRTGGTIEPIGVLLSAVDASQNASSCLNDVLLTDDIKPTVGAAIVTVSPDNNGVVTIDAVALGSASTDNCEVADYWTTDILDCDDSGTNNVTLYVMDEFGNQATGLIQVTVDDNVLPIARAKATVNINLDDQGQFTITPANTRAFLEGAVPAEISTDNCNDIVLYSVSPTVFNCSQVNTQINLTYTVTDGSNNVSDPFIIQATVHDNIAPIALTQNFNLKLKKDEANIIYFSDFDVGGYDNCGLATKGIFFDTQLESNMCVAGTEAAAGGVAILPQVSNGTLSSPDAAYPGYPLVQATDDNTSTAYITEFTTANTYREVILSFGSDQYNINRTTVLWSKETLIPQSTRIKPALATDIRTSASYNATYVGAKLNDEVLVNNSNYVGCYISAQGTNAINNYWVDYKLPTGYTLTWTNVRWFTKPNGGTPSIVVSLPTVNGLTFQVSATGAAGSYSNITGLTRVAGDNIITFATPINTTTTPYIRIQFDPANGAYCGIEEWSVYGYAGSRLYDNVLPTANNAIIEYRNTVVGGASDPWKLFGTATPGFMGVAYPGLNEKTVATSVAATDMRLRFRNTTTDGPLGIRDWEIWGSKVGAASNCKLWTCADVPTSPHTAHIVYVATNGQKTYVDKTFQVLPYFTILDVQLKDCAVTGEQYWSWLSNKPDKFRYDWSDMTNDEFILSDGIGNNTGVRNWSSTIDTIAQLRTTSTGHNLTNNQYYTINLTVTDTDNPGCTSTFPYTFRWSTTYDGATTVKSWQVCKGDTAEYTLDLVKPNTYYGNWRADSGNDNVTYTWDRGTAAYVSGGSSTNNSITVSFPVASPPVVTIVGRVGGTQRYVYYGSDNTLTAFPNVVPLSGTMNCSGGCYVFENAGVPDFTGPFNIPEATYISGSGYSNYDVTGKHVIRNPGTGSIYLDCSEGVTNNVTVLDVAVPTLASGQTANVCPFQQVTYTTPATPVYANYKWTIIGGRKVSGGGGSDLSVTVEWNMTDWPTTTPSVALEVTNALGCKASNLWPVTYDQTTGIAFDPASLNNTSFDADANSCAHTVPSIVPPVVAMPNTCLFKTLECSTDGGTTWKASAAGTYTGIGDHLILWWARDYFWDSAAAADKAGHEATWTQTLTIVDKQAPNFNNPLSVLSLETNNTATTCDVLFNQNTRDVTATDGGNCTPAASLVYTCELDRNDGNGWVNSPLPSKQTINGITFGVGTTRVRYTVSDNATPPNTAVSEFNVVVKDRTNPTIADLSSIANKTQATDAGADSATVIVTPPSGAALWDNCTALANLVVTGTRSDGLALTKRYPVGITTITWVVRDEANNPLPSNPLSYTQTIDVGDEEDPTFTDMTEFTAKTISYCSRIAYPIAIPVSKSDNVGVVQLDYQILDGSGTPVPGGAGSIKKSDYPNFKPNGTNFLDGFTFPAVDAVLGSTFTVIWTAIDKAGNTSDDDLYRYSIHVEMEPNFTEWTTNVDCNGATITVTEYPDNSQPAKFRYDRDHGYDAYYNIGTGWTTNTSFSVPGTGTYTLRMQVNGCEAPTPISIPVSEAEPYRLSTEKTDVDCPELKTGTVDLTMTGGVSQLLLAGSGYSSTYNELNLGDEGAIEAWVYLDNLADVTILSRSTYGLGLSTGTVDGKTVGYFNLFVGSPVPDVLTSTFVVAAHRWYHVSGSWNGTTMTITIDGTATDSQGSSQSATGAVGTAFVLGAGFSGMLREVSVWSAIPAGFGAIRNAGNKIQGNETGLVGFWDLGGGSGTEAKNRCGSYYAWAKDATGADTWASNKVQPGFYTWTKATATASGTYSTVGKSNINLTELDTATYTVSFVDPYGCAAANTSFEKIIATDDELPVIDLSGISTTHLLTTAGSCEYKFTDPDVVSNYVPIITESSNCNYKIKWQVIVDHDLGSWIYEEDSIVADENVLNKILGSTLGRKGTNGKNTVYITLSQNGLSLDPPVSYDIYLDDKIFPVAGGKTSTPSMNLDASGVVVYTALQHNDPLITEDNCSDDVDMLYEISSDGATWGPSINFNCDDIGQDVNVWFRVTDEAGNRTTKQTAITDLVVKDVTPPETHETSYQPLGPYCATADADVANSIPAYVDIPLSALTINRYTDNCGVYRISYKRDYDHLTYFGGDDLNWQIIDQRNDLSETIDFNPATLVRFYEGKTTVTFQLTDGDPDVVDEADRKSTEQPIFVVTVLPKPKPGDGSGGGIN